MSITAFPVLARILEELRIQSSALGATALMCAAVDDIAAWLLLALTMTLIPASSPASAYLLRLLWLGLYAAIMLMVIRPLGVWLAKCHTPLSHELLGIMIAFAFASSAVTVLIGIHPLFGAFLAGLCFLSLEAWQASLRTRLNLVVSLVLLPLFIALTGMRTRLDLLNTATARLWAGILLLAVTGRMGGAVVAARWTGQGWRSAVALGALLNTRGLVELVVLNIA
jgi:Kef-type K+ transport system membrane component KefB